MAIPPSATGLFAATPFPVFSIDDDYAIIYNKAKEFSQGNKELLNYITDVLKNPEFKKDPIDFYQKWADTRGYTEEYSFPEDKALEFFTNMYSEGPVSR